MGKNKSRIDCQKFDDFLVGEVCLEDVSVYRDTIGFIYSIEGEQIGCRVRYDSVELNNSALISLEKAKHFAVILAVICSVRFGALLPNKLNLEKYSQYIDKELLEFIKVVMRGHWSQHRYQIGRLDYNLPEFVLSVSELGKKATYPLWSKAVVENPVHILLASGSGKDSLLCSLILEAAEVTYDIVTYFHDTYGDDARQKNLFEEVTNNLKYKKAHGVYFYDEYYPWLEKRLKLYQRGVKGKAIELFEQKILNPLLQKGKDIDKYFAKIEKNYSQIYETHHTMPNWFWKKIQPVLELI
ncbi:MAG: hypothetical protein SWX82_02455 [Cyanobacteriota bacterium]|nr:hypothetical protein [Cyanobacteriota bacterium]